MAKSVADIRTRFNKLRQTLQSSAHNAYRVIAARVQPKQWDLNKDDWSGNVYDIAGMRFPFSRFEHSKDVLAALKDSDNPGVVGDSALSAVQGDFLAAAERAFRLLHSSSVRLTIHAAARKYGQGHAAGIYGRGLDSYLNGINKLAKQT